MYYLEKSIDFFLTLPLVFFSFLFPLRQFFLCCKEKLEVLKKCAAALQVAIYVPLQR